MSPAEIGKNKKKSTREKSSDIFSFRGLPPEIYNQLQSIALNEIKVSVGDLARRLFEYGLESYDNGNLNIDQKEIIDWISEINSPVKTKKD